MKKTFLSLTLGFLTISCLLFSVSLYSQSNKKKMVRVNGFPIEHKQRDTNKSLNDCVDSPFRTIDGTCNNQTAPNRKEWGATDIQLRREALPDYGNPDHYNDMGGQNRPSPRAVSNACVAQTISGESTVNLSSFVFTWGQFLDHDIDLTPEGHTEYEPVVLPIDEPLFSADIPFFRSEIHDGTGVNNYRQQTNLITSWIDASNVYGSDEDRAIWLRTFQDGKLKISSGNRLPFNTMDGEYASDIDPNAPSMAGGDGTIKLYVAGDVRANEQVGLTSLHTLFVREHNRICDELKAQGMSDDEQMYQIARKWVGAIIQSITYEEFLPALGVNPKSYNGYKQNVQPDVSNIFATAAYRLGHTMVTEELLLRDNNCEAVGAGSMSLVDAFFSVDPIQTYNIDPFLKGLSMQQQMEVDNYIVDELRNFLFAIPGSPVVFGLDLASLNIQRGRDHGLPPYNAVREAFGISPVQSFAQINPDPDVYNALSEIYENVGEIDAWVGMLAERHINGKSVGPTLDRILVNQFERLRDGDFFYYEKDNWFNNQQKGQIKNTTLADIIKRNTSIDNLHNDVFHARDCDEIGDNGPGGGGNGGGHGGGGGHSGGGHHGGGNLDDGGSQNLIFEDGNLLDFSTLESGLTVLPNPTGGDILVTLNTADATNATIYIMHSNGKIMQQSSVNGFNGSFQNEMDISGLSSGMYIVRVITHKASFARKIIKR